MHPGPGEAAACGRIGAAKGAVEGRGPAVERGAVEGRGPTARLRQRREVRRPHRLSSKILRSPGWNLFRFVQSSPFPYVRFRTNHLAVLLRMHLLVAKIRICVKNMRFKSRTPDIFVARKLRITCYCDIEF